MAEKKIQDLIHKELSFKIVGALFDVYNNLGFGYPEKIYQKALAEELRGLGLSFKRESFSRVRFKGKIIGSYFQDFVIEDKVVLEIKVGSGIYENNVNQVIAYLKDTGLRLGLLAVFTRKGILFRRVVN